MIWQLLKSLNLRVAVLSSNSILGYKPKRDENIHPHQNCTPVFIATLFTLSRMWKQPNQCMGEWNVVYPYSGVLFGSKKKSSPDICCNKDNPWKHVSESHSQKAKYCTIAWFHLYEMSRIGTFLEKKNRLVAWGWGRWRNGETVIANVLKLIVVMITQFCECTKKHWIIWHVNSISVKLLRDYCLSHFFFSPSLEMSSVNSLFLSPFLFQQEWRSEV